MSQVCSGELLKAFHRNKRLLAKIFIGIMYCRHQDDLGSYIQTE
jgi:hypothetical protein